MTITLQVLSDANTDTVHAAADAWSGMANQIDDACEHLIESTRDLEHHWPDGPAADAAHAKTRDTRNEASNAVPPCRTIATALRVYADTVRSLQNHLHQIIAEANTAGLQVDIRDGTVSAPQHMYDSAGSDAHAIAQQCRSYMWQLQSLAQQAADIDIRTAATLKANLPNAQTGFGSLSAPSVSRQQVETMKGKSPAEVNRWWNSLTAEQQDQVLRDYPDLAGNMNGVPADDRNTANRSWLSVKRDSLQARLDSINHQLRMLAPLSPEAIRLKENLWNLQKEKDNFDDIQQGLHNAGPQGMLLGVDSTGDGTAIIAIGNPDTARHTGVWVPGLSTDAGSTADNVERMRSLNDASDKLTPEKGDVSTVYWLGYDAPEVLGVSVAFEERSRQGGQPYVDFMQGLRATHDGEPGHLVAMGHSYGSTVLGEAAKTGDLPVNDIVIQGSPGMHVDHARDLNIDPRHVWAGSAADDPVSETSNVTKWTQGIPIVGPFIGSAYEDGHDQSPHYEDFGANKYKVDTEGHTDYWRPDSESLNNQARILMGQYEWTSLDHGASPTETR